MLGNLDYAPVVALVLAGLAQFPAVEARGAPPQIGDLAPLGVRRGLGNELTVKGANLSGNPRLIAPFRFQIEPLAQATKSDPANWKINLTVANDVAIGVYPVRVQTDDGISNPFLLAVGQLPQIIEKEENSTFETAQEISSTPVVIEGQVPANDVDFFRFKGERGQVIVIDAQCARIGSGIDPTIRLTTAGAIRSYIASADDSPGLLTDARLIATLPADGDYVVELSDSRYQGASRPVYRLLVGAMPIADEVFPLGGRAGETVGLEFRGGTMGGLKIAAATLNPMSATDLVPPRISSAMLGLNSAAAGAKDLEVESLAPLVASAYPEVREPSLAAAAPPRAIAPVVFNGRIDPAGDDDSFVLAVTPGQRLRIKVQAYEHGSALDAVVRVLAAGGSVLANADDTTIPLPPKNGQPQSLSLPDPSLEFTIPGGTNEVMLVLRDLENRGGIGYPYRIVVEPLIPDFELAANELQVSVPRGGTALVGVTIQRRGYSGPITVTVADPPAGLTVRPGTIAAGQDAGVLSLAATPDAAFPAAPIRLVARAQGVKGPLERLASKPVIYAHQPPLPTCSITEFGLVAAPALAPPVVLDTPSATVEIAHGMSTTLTVKVSRTKGADGPLEISPAPLPAGLAIPAVTIAEKAEEGKITVKSAVAGPLGTMTVGLQAKGKFGGAELILALPVVTLSVVPAATLELPAPALEIKPGTTVELKGKIVRKGGFDGPATIKITELPAGLKAEPASVAGTESSFVVKIMADAKAASASAASHVAIAYQIDKKDYSVPPTPLALKVLPIK